MKRIVLIPLSLLAVIVASSAEAETPAECKKWCDDKYDQCFKDAIEYGYDRAQARAGCQEKREACKKRC